MKYYDVVNYLYSQIQKCVNQAHITLMSDVNCTHLLEKLKSKGKKKKDFFVDKEICLRANAAVETVKSRLFIPSMQYDYTFYSKDQVFEIIHQFVL